MSVKQQCCQTQQSGAQRCWSYLQYRHIYDCISFKAYLMVCFMNMMHASVCPLLWWLYDDDSTWWMLRHLQKSWELFWNNFVPSYDIGLPGNLYFVKIIIHALLGYQCWSLQPVLSLGTCYGNLQLKDSACELLKKMSAPTDSNFLPGCLNVSILSSGCVTWMFRLTGKLQWFCVSAHNDPIYGLTCNNLVLYMPMWLTGSWSSALFCINTVTVIPLPFTVIPSITTL